MLRYLLLMLPLIFLTEPTEGGKKEKPTLFIIGDSTVKNGSGKGDGGLWGWGDFMFMQLDTSGIRIRNHARGGRSSRTFMTEGLWDQVLDQVRKGDYVIMQFGHNDGGAINDNSRARGSLRGTGDETEEIDNMLTGKHEVVHTFGWYMRKYISDTKSKGAIPIVCSLVPRNDWSEGKIIRARQSYAGWAGESAEAGDAFFIDLNELVAARYEAAGEEEVTARYFLNEHTHTTKEGAILNAAVVGNGIRSLKNCHLRKYLNQ